MTTTSRRFLVCAFLSFVSVLFFTSCRRAASDASGLVTQSEIEKIVGTNVTGTTIEAKHAVSMAGSRVMHSTSSCVYSLNANPGKPARIKISLDTYDDLRMMMFDFTSWKGAEKVSGIGDAAWQDTTALEILNKKQILVIETDETSESPKEPIPPSDETRAYPGIQTAVAKIALGRL